MSNPTAADEFAALGRILTTPARPAAPHPEVVGTDDRALMNELYDLYCEYEEGCAEEGLEPTVEDFCLYVSQMREAKAARLVPDRHDPRCHLAHGAERCTCGGE